MQSHHMVHSIAGLELYIHKGQQVFVLFKHLQLHDNRATPSAEDPLV